MIQKEMLLSEIGQRALLEKLGPINISIFDKDASYIIVELLSKNEEEIVTAIVGEIEKNVLLIEQLPPLNRSLSHVLSKIIELFPQNMDLINQIKNFITPFLQAEENNRQKEAFKSATHVAWAIIKFTDRSPGTQYLQSIITGKSQVIRGIKKQTPPAGQVAYRPRGRRSMQNRLRQPKQ